MSALTSRKAYVALSAFHAFDAVLCAIPVPQLGELLETIEVPQRVPQRPGGAPMGWILAVIKTAAALGLLTVSRFPGLARLTTAMLTVYFTIAVTLHARTFERSSLMTRLAMLLATFFLAVCAVMTVEGPQRR